MLANLGGERSTEYAEKGRQAAAKALSLDGDLAEAHAAVGAFAAFDGDWRLADTEFRRALDLNPGWAHGQLMYSVLCLVPTGRLDEAMRHAMRAIELDPFNRLYRGNLANIFYLRREFQRAVEEFEQLQEPNGVGVALNPSYVFSLERLARGSEMIPKLRAGFAGNPAQPGAAPALLAYLLSKNGERAEAERILKQLRSRHEPAFLLATVEIGLDDQDAAFRDLEAALASPSGPRVMLKVDPILDPLRGSPRFDALLRKTGLDEEPIPPGPPQPGTNM